MNKVGVILINWNGGYITKDCIDSLKAGSVIPAYIVVVDNDSKDGSLQLLNDSYGDSIHLIKNCENKGFAEANNQGIKYLIQVGVEYIWLLNNDTVVDTDCLKELMNVVDSCVDEKLGAVSSKIYYESQRDQVWFFGADRNKFSFAITHRTIDINQNLITPFISDCCIFAKTSVFQEFGGLQKQFIAYSEDDEWCLRLERNGYHFICAYKSVLYHKVSASLKKNTGTFNKISDMALSLMNRNHLWVIRKYAPHRLLSVFVMLAICLRNAFTTSEELKRISVYLRSIYHGLFDDIRFIRMK